MLAVLWSIVTLPFRLIGRAVELVGRFVGAAIGFVLMVVGVAICAARFWPIGLPLFLVGLLITMKSLR